MQAEFHSVGRKLLLYPDIIDEVSLSGLRSQVRVPVDKFIHELGTGEHGCIFAASREDMQNIQFMFIRSGLESDYGAVYTTATEPLENVRAAMNEYGIDTKKYEQNGSLILIRGEELYKNAEKPDLELWKKSARSISDNFNAKGKHGVRIAADLSSHFLSGGYVDQWFELEYALERKMSVPVSVLCAYDASMPSIDLTDILKYHIEIDGKNKEFVDAHNFVIYAWKDKNVIFTL